MASMLVSLLSLSFSSVSLNMGDMSHSMVDSRLCDSVRRSKFTRLPS